VSPYRVRLEALADDALVVVRGGPLDSDTLRLDAEAAHERFGEYGVSVLAAVDEAALDNLARDRLAQYEVLTVMTAGAIRRAGLELRPTFRRPHYTVMLPNLDEDVARLVTCENVGRENRHYRPLRTDDD
jgi:hypothetical protein